MKIGIITIVDCINYGNRLQNLAMQILLQDSDYLVDTLDIYYKFDDIHKRTVGLKYLIKAALPKQITKYFSLYGKPSILNLKRIKKFQIYNKKYMFTKTIYVKDYEQLKENLQLKDYEYFVAGSDQIWNPEFAGHEKYFLTFAPPEKRIALIASIGVKEIPNYLQEYYKKNISEMKYISVREKAASDLIFNLTGRKVDCVLDPTLLVERNKWENIMQKPKTFLPRNYIVSFFLGEAKDNELNEYANSIGLNIVRLNDERNPEYYILDPSEFLYVIAHAEMIFTDSFHAVAFSIKFHRQFYVFHRVEEGKGNMFSRMDTLLSKFDLSKRAIETIVEVTQEEILEKDFLRAEEIMRQERQHFDEILKSEIC